MSGSSQPGCIFSFRDLAPPDLADNVGRDAYSATVLAMPNQSAATRKVNPTTNAISVAGQMESARYWKQTRNDDRGQDGGTDEPFAAHELLGRLARGDVNQEAACRRADHAERDGGNVGHANLQADVHAHRGVPRQREGGHELVPRLTEVLAFVVGREQADDAGQDTEDQIPGIRPGAGGVFPAIRSRAVPPPMPPKIAIRMMPTTVHCLPR